MNYLHKVFEDAYKTEMACIILDNLENLLDYVSLGSRFSNIMLQGMRTLVGKKPPKKNRKLFIFGTASSRNCIDDLELDGMFDYHFQIPDLVSETDKTAILSK